MRWLLVAKVVVARSEQLLWMHFRYAVCDSYANICWVAGCLDKVFWEEHIAGGQGVHDLGVYTSSQLKTCCIGRLFKIHVDIVTQFVIAAWFTIYRNDTRLWKIWNIQQNESGCRWRAGPKSDSRKDMFTHIRENSQTDVSAERVALNAVLKHCPWALQEPVHMLQYAHR